MVSWLQKFTILLKIESNKWLMTIEYYRQGYIQGVVKIITKGLHPIFFSFRILCRGDKPKKYSKKETILGLEKNPRQK